MVGLPGQPTNKPQPVGDGFLGGYNVPSPGPFKERQRVGRKFGLLVLDEDRLTLRVKSGRLARLVVPVTWTADQVLTVAPLATDFLKSNAGVAIVLDARTHAYFFTANVDQLLEACSEHGFTVSSTPVVATDA